MLGVQKDPGRPPESDVYKVFEHRDIKCYLLHVLVERGYDISKGWLGNLFDRPDPYLVFWVPDTPNGKKKTRVIKNNPNPEWNEKLTFIINPDRDFELRGMLVDQGTAVDQVLGKVRINFSDLPLNVEVQEELRFKHGSSVMVKFLKEDDASRGPDLTLSPSLPEAELMFLDRRLVHVCHSMRSLLGEEEGPRDVTEVPRVAVVASGGGLRAAIGSSAALHALQRMGVLDCVTYLASLSGSTWYVSDLYSQPDFPEKGPGDFQQELKEKLTGNWLKVFCPSKVTSHLKHMAKKKKTGQPVTFTDLFGHLIGDLMLGSRKDDTLSSQEDKVTSGVVPLPLYTCVHIKKDVSARVYQDWVEFSPLQVGFLKHAVFMEPEKFGDKFYLGRTVSSFGEPPLHYLQGVWGSAYSVFLRRVIESSRRDALSPPPPDPEEEAAVRDMLRGAGDHGGTWTDDDGQPCEDDDSYCSHDGDSEDDDHLFPRPQVSRRRSNGVVPSGRSPGKKLRRMLRDKIRRRVSGRRRRRRRSKAEMVLSWLLRGHLLDTRAGRAGVVYSPMRGVQFSASESRPLHPLTTADDDKDFKGFYEPVCPDTKKLYMADSGLSFNLPYPPLLRPHRNIALYLSFEFSSRSKDDASPFEELKLAEKWAHLHKAPFPPVAQLVQQLPPGPLKECYVFEHPCDPLCPVIVHFVLVNYTFRSHKDIGVARETEEEQKFADFDIFSDPDKPYSSFKFSYEALEVERLLDLVDFNTRLSEPIIREQLVRAVARMKK